MSTKTSEHYPNFFKRWYSAKELADLRLDEYPKSARWIPGRLAKEKWEKKVVAGRGGPGGRLTLYMPPDEVVSRIQANLKRHKPGGRRVESAPENLQTVEIYGTAIQERSDATLRRSVEQPSGLTAGEQRMLARYRQAGPDGQGILEALAEALIEPAPSRWLKVGQLLQASADQAGKKD